MSFTQEFLGYRQILSGGLRSKFRTRSDRLRRSRYSAAFVNVLRNSIASYGNLLRLAGEDPPFVQTAVIRTVMDYNNYNM